MAPRRSLPPGTPHSGYGPPADGSRCIGCGISGHNTYSCPYQNIPFCYGCKRFGHIRIQCRPEWVADMPGDEIMPNPPVIPQWVLNPSQRPAIESKPSATTEQKNGNVPRISCCSKGLSSNDNFILDTGASYHVVNNPALLSQFYPEAQSRTFYTAEGESLVDIIGKGVLIIQCRTRDRSNTLTLTDILVAPAIPINVVSVAKLCQQNVVMVVFTDEYASFCRCEEIVVPNISSPRIVNEEFCSVRTSIPTSVIPDTESVVENVSDRSSSPRKCRATYFTSPFFSVPRNADNLYSFTLSLVFLIIYQYRIRPCIILKKAYRREWVRRVFW